MRSPTPIFLDTSFLLALASSREELHPIAMRWQKFLSFTPRPPCSFLTTEYVLLELADGFAERRMVSLAMTIIDELRSRPTLEVVPADSAWIYRGYSLFRERTDKAWGLTDCISFCVMNEWEAVDALTHDRHFEQAGFRALLRHEPPGNGR